MQPRDLGALCRDIVPGGGEVDVQPLSSGLLAETYRVTRDAVLYTLKIAVEDRCELGLEWSWSARLLRRAAAAGLAPPVVHSDPSAGVMLAQWVAGRPWSIEAAQDPGNSSRVAGLLRRVHALEIPAPPCAIDPGRWIDIYLAALAKRRAPAEDPGLRATAALRARELAQLAPIPRVICHSDLHALNLIEQKDALMLLDWEYAHAADPLWDVAGWSANNDLSPELQWRLLRDYGGAAPLSGDWRRLRLLLWLYDYVCLLWSRLYVSSRGTAARDVAERARLLDERLRIPAHYAAQ